jgi:hypothetical protein
MKLLVRSLITAALALTAAAADVTGKWSGSFKITTPDGQVRDDTVMLVLKQDGAEITGTAGPNADQQMPIQKGKIDGDKIALEVAVGEGTFKFDVVLEGDHIKGDVAAAMGGQTMKAKMDATRQK